MNKSKIESGIKQKEQERFFFEKEMGDFEYYKSEAWEKLTSRFGPKIRRNCLYSLAIVLSDRLNIELSRNYKRRKDTLVKWFDEHLDIIWPFMEEHIMVIDENDNKI